MFVGRKKELNYLSDCFRKESSQILVVYGQKGVGKTSLLLQFAAKLAGKGALHYYAARPCSEQEQIRLWRNEIKIEEEASGETGFDRIFSDLQSKQDGRKLLIVVDEFQNIVRYSTGFMEAAVRFVKSSGSSCMLVLLSSSISFVETDLVPRVGSSALGIGGFLKVPELGFMDCVNYFKECSTRQCMEIFSILGGIPAYWEEFDAGLSVEENIVASILRKGKRLHQEGEDIVAADLRELNVYCTILYGMANGKNKLNELHCYTGYSRAKISVYIKNLMERELVEKVFPFENASLANAKKGVYRISLRYLEFYFRFLYGHASSLQLLEPREYFERYIKKDLKAFHQSNFRKVCREYLEILNGRDMLPIKAVTSGEWIGKNGVIDLIFQDEEENSLLAFCDWEKEELGIADFERDLKIAEEARLKADHLYLFTAGHFSEELRNTTEPMDRVELVDIDTL